MRYRNPFQNRRNANVLRDNNDVTIGLAVLFLLSAVFAFGIIALLLVKKGYFKIDEKNVFLRATKCITLSAGLALLLVFSSCAGFRPQRHVFSARKRISDFISRPCRIRLRHRR